MFPFPSSAERSEKNEVILLVFLVVYQVGAVWGLKILSVQMHLPV